MRILIIGCGSIGRRHALNAKEIGVEVVLCDVNETLLQQVSSELGSAPGYTNYLQAIEKELASQLNTRVQIKHSPKKGRITIEYYGNDDLHRILERLGVRT